MQPRGPHFRNQLSGHWAQTTLADRYSATLGFDNSALEGHQCHGGRVTVKAKKRGNKENGYD